jgi:hypothetical protein
MERYDGVHFRVLRKAQREGYWPENLDMLILSAKYGLLDLDTVIEHYDLRMTSEQALQLKPLNQATGDSYTHAASLDGVSAAMRSTAAGTAGAS